MNASIDQSRIAQFCANLIETGWLAAVIVVPLFFNVWTHRVFEPDKLTTLRSLALIMLAGWVVLAFEHGRPKAGGLKAWLRTPLVAPVLLLTAVLGLASLTSFTPRLSIFGSYVRMQGLYTWLAYVVLFMSIVALLRRREQLERLLLAIILTSLPVALYGVVQRFGADPMPWLGDVTKRVASTLGNSIFVAAYLIMVVPLTLAKLVEALRDLDRIDDDAAGGANAAVLRVAGYLVLVAVQLGAIVLSGSRGPMLGLLGGLFVFALMLAVIRGSRRLIMAALGVGMAVGLFLVVFNLPGSPLAPLRDVAYIGRLGRVFETESGTGKVRVLIWGGAVELIKSDPTRMLIGWGPEAMHVAYNPFYPPELGNYEARNASPDRSHNETFDALVMTGFIGLAAYLLLFTSLFYFGLRWLGLIRNKAEGGRFLAFWLGGGALSVLGFYLWSGDFTFFGVALPAGMIAGLLAFVVLQSLRGWSAPDRPGLLLLVALLSAIIAHFIEIHFGIAIAATRTLFFSMAGLLVALGALYEARPELLAAPGAGAGSAKAAQSKRKRRGGKRADRNATPGSKGAILAWLSGAALMLAILSTLLYDFIVDPAMGADKFLVLIWLVGLSWAVGSLVLCTETYLALRAQGLPAFRGFGLYLGLTLGVSLVYGISHWGLLGEMGGADTSAALLLMYYFGLLLLMPAWAAVLTARRRAADAFSQRGIAAWFLYPAAALVALVFAFRSNVNEVRADIYYKQAWNGYHDQATAAPDYATSIEAFRLADLDYDRALALNPDEDYYMLFKGKALLEKAAREAGAFEQRIAQELGPEGGLVSEYSPELRSVADQRDRQFEEALRVLNQALEMAPHNPDHYGNMARAYQIWGESTVDESRKAERLAESKAWFEQVIQGHLAPNNAGYREEMALTDLLAGDEESALARIEEAREIDPFYMRPYRLLGRIHREAGRLPEAEEAYRTYLESLEGKRDVAAWSELAFVQGRAGDLLAAIDSNEKILEIIGQEDVTTLTNLAILARDLNDMTRACGYVERSAAASPEDPVVGLLVQEMNCPGISLPAPDAGGQSQP